MLPDQLTPQDIQAYLELMGMMGDLDRLPGGACDGRHGERVDQVADKDLLVLGSISRQPLIAAGSRTASCGSKAAICGSAMTSPLDRVYTVLDPNAQAERDRVDQLLVSQGDNLSAMIGMRRRSTLATARHHHRIEPG